MRALIVDDLPGIRTYLARVLREHGYDVVEAADGLSALELLAQEAPFDIAIVDWKMPRMDGYRLVRELRADPAYDGLPILVLSGEMDVFKISRVLDAGASEYLMKPFTRQTLLEKLTVLGVRGRRPTVGAHQSVHS